MTFPGIKIPYRLSEFSATQAKVPLHAAALNLLPFSLQKLLIGQTIQPKWHEFFLTYRPLVQRVYGHELAALPSDACGQSSCLDVLTVAIRDTLFLAGGLSVPSGLNTAVWTVFNGHKLDPTVYPPGAEIMADNWSPSALFWESLRFFPPVLNFPMWEKPFPAAATVPPAERKTASPWFTKGSSAANPTPGKHMWLNLAMAMRDPNAWGADAHLFKKRSLKTYHDKSVGFLEGFADKSYKQGAMDRVCPGRTVGLNLGYAFLKVWKATGWTNWCVDNMDNAVKMTWTGSFVNSFRIKKQATADHICKAESSGSSSWGGFYG